MIFPQGCHKHLKAGVYNGSANTTVTTLCESVTLSSSTSTRIRRSVEMMLGRTSRIYSHLFLDHHLSRSVPFPAKEMCKFQGEGQGGFSARKWSFVMGEKKINYEGHWSLTPGNCHKEAVLTLGLWESSSRFSPLLASPQASEYSPGVAPEPLSSYSSGI